MGLLTTLGLRPTAARIGNAPNGRANVGPVPAPNLAGEDAGEPAPPKPARAKNNPKPDNSRVKQSLGFESEKSGWGFEVSRDSKGSSLKISKTIAKKEYQLGAGLLHGKLTASATVNGQGVAGDDGSMTGTLAPEVKGTAGIEFGIKEFNISLSGQVSATADLWTVECSKDGRWTVAGCKPISLSVALVGEATMGPVKYACEPVGSYEVAVFDLTVPAVMPGKDLERLRRDVEAIVNALPEVAKEAGRVVPAEGGGGPIVAPESPLGNAIGSAFQINHLEKTEQNQRTDDGQVQRGLEANKRYSPYEQKVAAQARVDQREQDRQAEIKKWRGPVATAKAAAIDAGGWIRYAQKNGNPVSAAAESLAGQAYTQKALLEAETDHFELACKDANYEPKAIGTHAQKRIQAWGEVKKLFDQGHAANRA